MVPTAQMDSRILNFEFKNINRWTDAFEAYCTLEAGKSNIKMDAASVGLNYVKILNFTNDKFRKLYTKYERSTAGSTISVEGIMSFLRKELAPVPETKSAEIHSRILKFKFRKLDKNTFDSLTTLLDEYRENSGQPFSSSLLCTALIQSLPHQVLEQIAYNNHVELQDSKALLNYVQQLCNRAEKISILSSADTNNQGDVEMNFIKFKKGNGRYEKKDIKHNSTEKTIESNATPHKDCFHCGNNHATSTVCPAKGKTCNKCGKPNHFATVCKSQTFDKFQQKNKKNVNKKGKKQFTYHEEPVQEESIFGSESENEYALHINEPANLIEEKAFQYGIHKAEEQVITCIVDTGCTKPLFPKSLTNNLTNTSIVESFVSTAMSERKLIKQVEGDLCFVVNDTCNKKHEITIRGSLNSIEGSFLMPALAINTMEAQPYMILNGIELPIYKKGSLWNLNIRILHKEIMNNEKVDEENQDSKQSLSLRNLRDFNINPMNGMGQIPTKEKLIELSRLFVQVMHVRTGHYSAQILKTFLAKFNIRIPVSQVQQLILTCKACASKVVHKKPKAKAKSKRGSKQKDIPEQEEEKISEVEEITQSTLDKCAFNHILYHDCLTLPKSLRNNTKASVIVDKYSGFCSIKPITTANSQETAQHLLQWISIHGSPFAIQTDNGSEFDSHYQQVLYTHNILERKGAVARPEHQGQVERLNREIRQHVDIFIQTKSLTDECWEWAAMAFEYNHNKSLVKNEKLAYEHAFGKMPTTHLWPGDRVCFKPRIKDDTSSSHSEIVKKVAGTFVGKTFGGKSCVMVFLPDKWTAHFVDAKEVKPLPITLTDCIRIVIGGFAEPNSIDLAVREAMMDSPDGITDIVLKKISPREIHYNLRNTPTEGKTHLDVTKEELKNGSHDEAIIKELSAFVDNNVFAGTISREQALKENYEIISFKGIPTWKLKDGKRIAKWRGVCRGFEDRWNGDVDTDAPTPSMIRLCFLIGLSRGKQCAYADATTAFLQVDCPKDRKVAVVMGKYIPREMQQKFRPGEMYILNKMLYGLKDSPRKWVLFLKSKLELLQWKHCGWGIFKRKHDICLVYYDDICIFSQDPIKDLNELKKHIKMDNPLKFEKGNQMRYIGCNITHHGDSLTFDISDYCKSIQSQLNVKALVPNRTSCEELEKTEGELNKPYLKDIGKLGWISAHTHHTCFSYSFMSRFSRGNNLTAMRTVRWIMDHIKNKPPPPYHMTKIDSNNIHIDAYCDASLSKSLGEAQLGNIIMLKTLGHNESSSQSNVISFKSCKYRRVVRSTGQAELAALSMTCDDILTIKITLESLNCTVNLITIKTDSKVVVDQLKNPHKAEIHSRNMARFTSQTVVEHNISIIKVTSEEQLADPLTKFIF